MLRFNSDGKFNLPVGNVDFNKNVIEALNNYFYFVQKKEILVSSLDFKTFIKNKEISKKGFVYLDPPYLISASEYNKNWNELEELALLDLIDDLNIQGVKFALSNVTHYNHRDNSILIKWMNRYNVHEIKSNYINYHNNKQKKVREVLITNY